MSFLTNKNEISKCMPEEIILLRTILLISGLIIEWSIFLYLYMDKQYVYYYIPDKYKTINDFLIILSLIPGRTILVLNAHIFFFSFLQQLYKMKNLETNIKKREWIYNNKRSISLLCYEIIDIRYTLSRLIKKIEYMYSSVTIIGGIVIGIVIEYSFWDIYNITCLILFIILQFIFLNIIYRISDGREEILKLIYDRTFVFKYLINNDDIKINIEKNTKLEKDVNNIMDMEEIDDEEEIFTEKKLSKDDTKKSNNFSTLNDSINSSMEIKNNMENILRNQINLSLHGDNEVITEIYKKTIQTNSSIDWLILNNLLSKEWENFQVLGIQINHGKVLIDAVIITSLFIASGSLMGFLTEIFDFI